MRKLIDRIPGNGMRRTIALILTIIITFTTTYSLVLPAITLEKDTAETMSGISMRENGQRGDISASSEEEIESAAGTETGSTDPVAFDVRQILERCAGLQKPFGRTVIGGVPVYRESERAI